MTSCYIQQLKYMTTDGANYKLIKEITNRKMTDATNQMLIKKPAGLKIFFIYTVNIFRCQCISKAMT
jgi:hypothetical protein